VAEREAPARGEAAEVLEMGVVLGVEVEEVPARSEEAEVLGATGVVQGVVVKEGPALTNESLRDWVNRWCSGDRGGLPPISTWNTSQVTDMSELFQGKSEFNDDIGAWDTSGVTTMYYMFDDASAFNQPLGDWRLGSICYTQDMFAGTDFQNSRRGPCARESCCAKKLSLKIYRWWWWWWWWRYSHYA